MSLFLGQVTNVYPKRVVLTQTVNGNLQGQVQREAYTIDVKMPAGRLDIQGVRVLSPTSGTNAQNGSGFIWMPAIDDWVVCGYIEDYPDHAVCFGAIKHPYYGKISTEGQGYQDFIIHHQSDSWIRIRDLEKYNSPSSNQTASEIKIHHKSGSEITMNEPSSEQCEISITHQSGTYLKIKEDGTVDLTSSGTSVKINDDGSVDISANKVNIGASADYKVVLGDLIRTYLETHTHYGNLGYPTGTPIQPYNNYLSETIKVQK